MRHRGFLIAGRPGSGKTLLMREMLRGFRQRGDRGLIADPDGSYLSVFARAGDRILNPFDARSERWSPFAEIRDDNDFELLAKAVVPVSESATEEEWRGYARTLLAAILRSLHREGRSNAAEVVRTVNSAAGEPLRHGGDGHHQRTRPHPAACWQHPILLVLFRSRWLLPN